MRALLAVLALSAPSVAAAQEMPRVPAIPLATAGLAGQNVAVLPLTMLTADPRVPGTGGASARATLLAWADSLLADVLLTGAPEVVWVLPASLRATARKAAGLVPSPDHMGQAVMRAPNLKEVPDPLRTHLRKLLGMAGGARYALIPAALTLAPAGPAGERLELGLSVVLADGRTGQVVWRTLAVGNGETADAAGRAALATLFPPGSAPSPSPPHP